MLSENLYESLKDIGDATSVVYAALFLLAFFFEKKMSSATVALLVLCLTKGIAILLLPYLLEIASASGIHNKFAWYGSWMLLDVICIALILKFHISNKIRASKVALTVSLAYVALTIIQAIDFIDRATIDNGFFATAYQISIPTISIGLIPLICYFWLQDFRKIASHNRDK
ncbi:hypothetical protein [Rheinheimera texasensis]|uniref:hypothetical protein n=1 Tax=Rheinheimera texasensis TaxID=306205 RepID=UPI0032B1D073